jgi:hypothetical protein
MATTHEDPPQSESDHIAEPDLDGVPAPGALGLIGRRAFKPWQVFVVAVLAVGIGMLANYRTVGGAAKSSNKAAYNLPGSSTAGSTTTLASGASTTTTSAVASPPTAGASTTATTAPVRILLAGHQQNGNWTSSSFTTSSAGWIIGWAFQCTPAPASGPSLQIFVTPVGGTASGSPVITETGASGQESQANVTTQSAIGTQQLVVEAPANCQWAVKVSGN